MTRSEAKQETALEPRAAQAAWMSDAPSPAVVLRFEELDSDGRTVLVHVGEDDALLLWSPAGSENPPRRSPRKR